jgi:flagellin-specific chaperone FliS
MNVHGAYQQQHSVDMSRIDQVLGLYDGAIERLEKAARAMGRFDEQAAQQELVHAKLFVGGIASGLDMGKGELPLNLMRLCEFAANCIAAGTLEKIEAALTVLRNLREGFQEIRPEAARLERSGAIPRVDSMRLLHVRA